VVYGIVFRCSQAALGREVAVKVLTAELDQNRERFLREQRAMGALTGHPNIVGVLQVGETVSGYPYLVMQYHRHGSLEARIHGSLPGNSSAATSPDSCDVDVGEK
jgi:serine/threonine protein kinase